MEKGGNNWTRKIFLQGRRKTEKEIRKTQKGKETEGNILKGGKYLEKEIFGRYENGGKGGKYFLAEEKKNREGRGGKYLENENIFFGGEGKGGNCLEKKNIFWRRRKRTEKETDLSFPQFGYGGG